MTENQIMPVEEMVQYDEFCDRVEILRELDEWVKGIGRMASGSTAIIAPRRMGKTVLLDRLVNTVFFKPEYKVAPFYFKMKREKTTLYNFLLVYATTFFRQYIAYCAQDPELFNNEQMSLEKLIAYKTDHKAGLMAQESIQNFLERYRLYDYEGPRNQWDEFIRTPERLASHSGTRVAVIIDEFQDMKFFVYDTSHDHFSDMKAKGLLTDQGAINLTATYDRQAQSRKAPMLVSGSAVTMVFRTVMGGPLGGRFGFEYLRPLSIPDGAALLINLLPYYAPNMEITPEMALYASGQTGGHPYYLYCLAVSKYEGKDFKDQQAIDRLIRYEIEKGKIYGFWQTHFEDNRKYINEDDDLKLGRKIIYYFTKYNDQPVDIRQIAEKLKVPKEAVEQKIEKLYEADLVYKTEAKFFGFNDICLMRYIKFVYEKDLEGIEKVDLSQRNLFNTLKGKFLEMAVQVTMMKFNHEMLPGVWFGKTGEIRVPLFSLVTSKSVKGTKTALYQIDVFAMENTANRVWLCECKYTRTKMGIGQVKKLEKAADAFRKEKAEYGGYVPDIHFWLISTGGFTDDALAYAASRDDMYASDYDGINSMFQAFGGNYHIPVFHQTYQTT